MEDYNLAVTISVQNADRPFICTYFLLELINSLILCCIRIKYNIYNNDFFCVLYGYKPSVNTQNKIK